MQYHTLSENIRYWPKRNTKIVMTMYAGIFIGNYTKSMTSQWYEHEPDGVIEK